MQKQVSSCVVIVTVLFLLTAEQATAASLRSEPMNANATRYLTSYGYMNNKMVNKMAKATNHTSNEMAIIYFQKMVGLSMTGKLDKNTMDMMEAPRCGMPDMTDGMGNVAKRRRRYVAQGKKWSEPSIKYRILDITKKMSETDVKRIIRKASELWSNVSGLSITEALPNSPKADINIKFATGDHRDGSAFDGEGRVLAHAFFPQVGDMHFDDSEAWTDGQEGGTGIDLFQVAVHELGHSIGLAHSEETESIMAPIYKKNLRDVKLDYDDIRGVQYIYGPATTTTARTTTRFTQASRATPSRTTRHMDNDWCVNARFDAIVLIGTILYIFKESQYVELDQYGIRPNFPRRIRDLSSELPYLNSVDAALFWANDQDRVENELGSSESLYLFKNDTSYKFKFIGGVLRYNATQKIRDAFPGIPTEQLDAAFVWSGNGKPYFIRGAQYWGYNTDHLYGYYPRPLSVWTGVPNRVNAAFNLHNGRTYFFAGDQYYRFNDVRFTVDRLYPQPAALWLGCPSSKSSAAPFMAGDSNVMDKEMNQRDMQFNPSDASSRLALPMTTVALAAVVGKLIIGF